MRAGGRDGRGRAAGFSLIEMAVVLFIVVLLLGSLLVPFATQVEQRRIAETRRVLEEVREALIGYAASHAAVSDKKPYLPCPDTDNDGFENRTASGACAQSAGLLPWAELGVARSDAWGNRFHYAVTQAFSHSQTGFGLATPGDLTVCATAKPNGGGSCSPKVVDGVPVVVLSYGRNGYGAVNEAGLTNPLPASADELENTGADPDARFYVARTLTPAGAPAGEFDDVVTWLSRYVLLERMVAAQRLP